MSLISQINRVAYGLLKLNSRLKDVRDITRGNPFNIVKRHVKGNLLRWIARK